MDENKDKKYVYFLVRLGEKRRLELYPNFSMKVLKQFYPDIYLYEIFIDKKKIKNE